MAGLTLASLGIPQVHFSYLLKSFENISFNPPRILLKLSALLARITTQ